MIMNRLLVVVTIASSLCAQDALDNGSVLKLVQAGVGDELIIALVASQPGTFALDPESLVALKTGGASDKVIAALLTKAPASAVPAPQSINPASPPESLLLPDGTPVKMRLTHNVSSTQAKVGDTVEFEVLSDVSVGNCLLVKRGTLATGTVVLAEKKKMMARGGRLGITVDSVSLLGGGTVALRGAQEKGAGHANFVAMTAGMIATAVVFLPATPVFLLMHGSEVTIPKGTAITAFVEGDIKLDLDRAKSISQFNMPDDPR
jgi:hypothetical protein